MNAICVHPLPQGYDRWRTRIVRLWDFAPYTRVEAHPSFDHSTISYALKATFCLRGKRERTPLTQDTSNHLLQI